MKRRHQLFIDGEYCDAVGGKTFEVTSPANNEVIAEVASATAEDVDRAVRAARRAFESANWRGLEVKDRIELLRKLGDMILRCRGDLAKLEAIDTGNPVRYTSEFYVPGAAACLHFYPHLAYHLAGQQIPVSPNHLDYTIYEPLGVVAVIVPWNDPLEIACGRLASALAAGNTCVLKPSPLAPLTCLQLGELAREAGFPPGVLNILAGADAEAGTPLIHHPGVDMISFTGSVRTGELIQHAAAETTKRVSLELGGKSPNIVFADADLAKAVPGAAQAVLLMTGQNCVAGSRLYLHEKIYDEFLTRLIKECDEYPVGDPLDPKTMLGPLISRPQWEKVKQYVASGLADGAKLRLGGRPLEDPLLERGNYFPPTIFTDVSPEVKIGREEIFGPVLCVFRFSSADEAIRQANDTQYGLGAGVWTQDVKLAHRVAAQLQAGTIYINTYNEFFCQTPFAGYRRSGLGYEYGLDALHQYVQRKNVIVRLD